MSDLKATCQTKRETYGDSSDNGFQCQFEGLYRKVINLHYPDFYENFFKHSEKNFCAFHAPMEAKKIEGKGKNKTKAELIAGDTWNDDIKVFQEKFYNVIYGIINQQSDLFNKHLKGEDRRIKTEHHIDFREIIFPISLILTKDRKSLGEEHKKYSSTSGPGSIIPYINFSNCIFHGLEIKSGTTSNSEHSKLIIDGASFANASFNWQVELVGVNFAPEKQNTTFSVSFDRAIFQCTTIKLTGSEFNDVSFTNAKINAYFIEFNDLLIHSVFDMSCYDGAEENLRRIKNLMLDSSGISFLRSNFGDELTYNKSYQTLQVGSQQKKIDMGGRMICRNRIFECDVHFNSCSFYQAPDFRGTSFNGEVQFESSEFLPSSFKYKYHRFYRYIKYEMARINLYREERAFWRYEEKCLEESSVTLISWKGVPVDKIRSFLIKFLNKKPKPQRSEFFFTYHSYGERIISQIFDFICKRGTSFSTILLSLVSFPIFIFPIIYLICDISFWFFLRDWWQFIINNSEFSLPYPNLLLEGLRKSFFYTTHPFSAAEEVKELKDYKFSLQTIISYAQSIIQLSTYIILGFMLRKRFRMSSD